MGRKEGRKAAFPRSYWQVRDEFDYKMEWAYDVQVQQYMVEVLSLSRWNTFLEGRKEGRLPSQVFIGKEERNLITKWNGHMMFRLNSIR